MLTQKKARALFSLLLACLCAPAMPALADETPGIASSPLTFAVENAIQREDTLSFTVIISAKQPDLYVLMGYDESPDTIPPDDTTSYRDMAASLGKAMLYVGMPRITVDMEAGFSQTARTAHEDGLLLYFMEITGISPAPDMAIDVRVTFESRSLFDGQEITMEDGTVQTQVAEGPLLRSALRFFSGPNERTPPPGEAADETETLAEEFMGNG